MSHTIGTKLMPHSGVIDVNQEVSVMGNIMCERSLLGGYGKYFIRQFLILNAQEMRLECYNSDQDHTPFKVIPVSEIQHVTVRTDKQNKFFDMKLRLRSGKTLCFRMTSLEERTRWWNATVALQKRHQCTERSRTLLASVNDAFQVHGKRLGVRFLIDPGTSLINFSLEQLGKRLLRVVDNIAALVAELRIYFDQGSSSPIEQSFHPTIDSVLVVPRVCPEARHISTTELSMFDAEKKRLTLNVYLSVRPDGSVDCVHETLDGALHTLTCSAWSDRALENWYWSDPAREMQLKRISEYLNISEFHVRFQWECTESLSDREKREFVEVNAGTDLLTSFLKDLSSVGGELFANENLFGDDLPQTKRGVLEKYVTGLRLCITLNDNTSQQRVIVEHSIDEDTTLKGAQAALREFSVTKPVAEDCVVMQLRSIAAHGRLGHVCTACDRDLSAASGFRDGSTMDYGSVARALTEIVPTDGITEDVLSAGIWLTAAAYAARLRGTVQALREKGMSEVVRRCVCSSVVQFTAKGARPLVSNGVLIETLSLTYATRLESTVSLLPLAVVDNVDLAPQQLRNISLCITEPYLSHFLEIFFSDTSNVVEAPPLTARTRVAAPPLTPPSEHSVSPNRVARGGSITPVEAVEDESEQILAYYARQEAVAIERHVETRILSISDVVNFVVDLQQGLPFYCRVGADVIRNGINALDTMFANPRVEKHALLHILVATLDKLRSTFEQELFSAKKSGVIGPGCYALPPKEAFNVLNNVCEYDHVRHLIQRAVARTEGDRMRFLKDVDRKGGVPPPGIMETGIGPNSDSTDTDFGKRLLDYSFIADAFLSYLLPDEAKLAVSLRRNVLVIGLDGAGKSLVVNNIRQVSQPTLSTIGVVENIVAYENLILCLLELGGRAWFRSNWKHYFNLFTFDIDGIAVVIDITDKRITECKAFISEILLHRPFYGLPVVFILNSFTQSMCNVADFASSAELEKKRHEELAALSGSLDFSSELTAASHAKRGSEKTRFSKTLHRLGLSSIAKEGGHEFQYAPVNINYLTDAKKRDPVLERSINWLCKKMTVKTSGIHRA